MYTVSLAVSGLGGSDVLTRTGYITAYRPLVVDFVGSPRSGDAPLTVQFASTVTGTATAYQWRFGDGGVAYTPNPTHTYESGGSFGVTLTVSDNPSLPCCEVCDLLLQLTTGLSGLVVSGNTADTCWDGTDLDCP